MQNVAQSVPKQIREVSYERLDIDFTRNQLFHLSEWDGANPHKNKTPQKARKATTGIEHLLSAMTSRDSPRSSSSSSVAPTQRRRPLRKAATWTAAALLWLFALAGRADACTVYVLNNYNVSLTVNSYNGWDGICLDSWGQYTVGGYGASTFNACRVVSCSLGKPSH
jgi:hypothetical protein